MDIHETWHLIEFNLSDLTVWHNGTWESPGKEKEEMNWSRWQWLRPIRAERKPSDHLIDIIFNGGWSLIRDWKSKVPPPQIIIRDTSGPVFTFLLLFHLMDGSSSVDYLWHLQRVIWLKETLCSLWDLKEEKGKPLPPSTCLAIDVRWRNSLSSRLIHSRCGHTFLLAVV